MLDILARMKQTNQSEDVLLAIDQIENELRMSRDVGPLMIKAIHQDNKVASELVEGLMTVRSRSNVVVVIQ